MAQQNLQILYRALLSVQNEDECAALLSDLLTGSERDALCQRLRVAEMLRRGCTYEQIRQQEAVGSTTITRISTELQFGAGGYAMVLSRLQAQGVLPGAEPDWPPAGGSDAPEDTAQGAR